MSETKKPAEPPRHTPGPWAWDGNYSLRPVTPQPECSAVHTILSPDGCYGYVGADRDAVHAEDEANRRLIATAPDLLGVANALIAWCEHRPSAGIDEIATAARAAVAKIVGGA